MVPVVPKPEVKPVIPTPVVPMPEAKPVIPAPVVPKPEVTPEPKPVVPMPEVKPKPMLPKPEVTPEPKPLVPMPEVKPKLVLPKPEVTPEPKPVVPLPEVKPKPMVPKPAIEDTRTDDQKIEQAKADVKVLSAASRAMMMKDPDFQPEDFKLEMLKAFVENDKVLTDPWGKPYQFKLLPTTEGRPRIQFFTKSTNGTAIAWPVK
jgi:hypothetical protein